MYRSRVAAAARAVSAVTSASALPPAAAAAAAAATAEPSCDDLKGIAAAPQPVQLGQATDPASEGQGSDVSPATAATADDAQSLLTLFETLQGRLAVDDVKAALVLLQQLGRAPITAALLARTGAYNKQQPNMLCRSAGPM